MFLAYHIKYVDYKEWHLQCQGLSWRQCFTILQLSELPFSLDKQLLVEATKILSNLSSEIYEKPR